jgi:uncharacterized protein YcfJ
MISQSKPVLLPLLTGILALGTAGLAQAQEEQGRVLSTTPVVQQVVVPRQVCQDQAVSVPGQKSGAGAVIGGIAGGAMGNAIGNGGGRALATVIGVVGGAMVGDRIEGSSAPTTRVERHCSTQNVYENRTVAYHVVYEYAGRQYTTQMPQDPGRYVRLSVTPVGALPPPPPVQNVYHPQPQVQYVPATPITRVVVGSHYYPSHPVGPQVVYVDGHRFPPGHWKNGRAFRDDQRPRHPHGDQWERQWR